MNVEGNSCDRCKPGSFALYSSNPYGCSTCYCSGVTSQCTEAKGLMRKRVSDVLIIIAIDVTFADGNYIPMTNTVVYHNCSISWCLLCNNLSVSKRIPD